MPSDTPDRDYSEEEESFIRAMERYRREKRRPFPNFTEVLAVAKSQGYRRVEKPGPLPDAPTGR